jgi:hypothetical protein
VGEPLIFVETLQRNLQEAGVRFTITSGLACVHYGLQQTTKDSDWIIPPDDLIRLAALFVELEERSGWRISYRAICGAPADASYLKNGWTSHFAIWEPGDAFENHLDLFSKPPRVGSLPAQLEPWAPRDVVAMMKRTDRPRDWPIVDGLGWQLSKMDLGLALVHIQDAEALVSKWGIADSAMRENAMKRRPLLRLLQDESDLNRIEALVNVERIIWQSVNRERHAAYQKSWKDFYRRWRETPKWEWPTVEPFKIQHNRLLTASKKHGLSIEPITPSHRDAIIKVALENAAVRASSTPEVISLLVPPLSELLP